MTIQKIITKEAKFRRQMLGGQSPVEALVELFDCSDMYALHYTKDEDAKLDIIFIVYEEMISMA